MDWITDNWAEISGAVALAIILASRIARLTPTKTDNKILDKVRKLARVVGIDVEDKQ